MDSKQAAAYLIDPLNAPEPSQETGPGTHFVPPPSSTASPAPTPSSPRTSTSNSTNPFRRSSIQKSPVTSSHSRQTSREFYAPPASSSPREKFPAYRSEALGGLNDSPPPRRSNDQTRLPTYDTATSSGRRRGSSLNERYPGDTSHKPLDMIRRDSKKAHRAPHLNKRHIPGADMIDRLDPTINKMAYHHEGPYDAALLARNTSFESSPIAALKETNAEALKATPRENIKDALERHRPLDGTAVVPPGVRDSLGRVYNYEEGTDMMRTDDAPGGAYKRYPGVEYNPADLDGQSEPSFTLDRALKAHTIHERDFDGQRGIELSDRPLMKDYDKLDKGKKLDDRDPVDIAGDDGKYTDLQYSADTDAHVKRTGSLRRAGEGLKKRIGSLRRKS